MYFWSNGLWKTWLDKCVKCRVSEDPSTSNMGNGPKHCQKLKDSTFTIFIDPCERNSGWRSHSKWYAKSKDCLLTHYLLITGFLSLIETIYSNIFRTIYARMEKYVLHFFFFFFFLHFRNINSILNIFKNEMTVIADVFVKLPTPKNVVR